MLRQPVIRTALDTPLPPSGFVRQLTKHGRADPGSELFGRVFEHFIALEMRAWQSCTRQEHALRYRRSTSRRIEGQTQAASHGTNGITARREMG